MKKEFVEYNDAISLKELGFDEPCFMYYYHRNTPSLKSDNTLVKLDDDNDYPVKLRNSFHNTKAPLYQQAFNWLYNKLEIKNGTMPLDEDSKNILLKNLIEEVQKIN